MNGNLKNQTIFLTPVNIMIIIFVGAPSATLCKAANGSLVIEPLCKLTINAYHWKDHFSNAKGEHSWRSGIPWQIKDNKGAKTDSKTNWSHISFIDLPTSDNNSSADTSTVQINLWDGFDLSWLCDISDTLKKKNQKNFSQGTHIHTSTLNCKHSHVCTGYILYVYLLPINTTYSNKKKLVLLTAFKETYWS